jgi:hypothetical protein
LWAVSGSALRKRLPYEYGCVNMLADTFGKEGGRWNIWDGSKLQYV